LVREIREFWQGCLVLGGGINDGHQIRAAEALGADLVYMGTRFIATQESNAQDAFKQMVIDSTVADLVYTDRLSGVHANFLKPSLDKWGIDVATLPPKKPDMSSLTDTSAKLWKDLWSAGQGVATIHDAPTVAELVDRIASEYDEACRLGRSPAVRRIATSA
jgi:nitronate monooxygenase